MCSLTAVAWDEWSSGPASCRNFVQMYKLFLKNPAWHTKYFAVMAKEVLFRWHFVALQAQKKSTIFTDNALFLICNYEKIFLNTNKSSMVT